MKSFGGGVFLFCFFFLKRPVLGYFKNQPIFLWASSSEEKKFLVIKIVISLSDFMDSFLHYVSRTICKK